MSRNAKLVAIIGVPMFSTVLIVAMIVANIRYNAGYESGYSTGHGHTIRFPKYIMAEMYVNPRWTLFDENGIAMVDYGAQIGIQYNPVTISQYALYNYHQYFDSGNETAKETFFTQADWLVEHARQKTNYSVWEYEFDWNYCNMSNPWVSAMAQGLGISVLVRAYNLSMNAVYLNTIHSSINAFEVEMNEGGVRYTDSDGIWFEEYADENCRISKVLNGFIFSLFGLYEVSGYSNKANELFWVGTDTLASNIRRYDTGYWSYYDLLGLVAPLSYHEIHIGQLKTMYEITGDEIFLEHSNLFHSYLNTNKKDVVH